MSAISVEIPEDIRPSLEELATAVGMTPSEYLLDLLIEEISDRRLVKIADERMAEHLACGSKTYSLEEVVRELGLED